MPSHNDINRRLNGEELKNKTNNGSQTYAGFTANQWLKANLVVGATAALLLAKTSGAFSYVSALFSALQTNSNANDANRNSLSVITNEDMPLPIATKSHANSLITMSQYARPNVVLEAESPISSTRFKEKQLTELPEEIYSVLSSSSDCAAGIVIGGAASLATANPVPALVAGINCLPAVMAEQVKSEKTIADKGELVAASPVELVSMQYNILRAFLEEFSEFDVSKILRRDKHRLVVHVPGSFPIKNTPFNKKDVYFQNVDLTVKVSKNPETKKYSLSSIEVKSTFMFFKLNFPVVITLDQFKNLWERFRRGELVEKSYFNQLWDKVSFSTQKGFSFQPNLEKILPHMPAMAFPLPSEINLQDLLIPGASLFPSLPNFLQLDLPIIKLGKSELLVEPKNGLVVLSSKTSRGNVHMVIAKRNEQYDVGYKLENIETKGELANLLNHVDMFYSTQSIPAFSITAGLELTGMVALHDSSIPALRKVAQMVGINKPLAVSIRHSKTTTVLSAAAKENTFNFELFEMTNLVVVYDLLQKKRVKLSGDIEFDFFGNNVSLQGSIHFSQTGEISGHFKLKNSNEIALPLLRLFMSEIGLTVKPAADQGVKLGLESDFTLEPRNIITSDDEIGHVSCAPGTALVNTDFEATFPRPFELSLAQILKIITHKEVNVPHVLDPIRYSGFERNGNFHPLTIRYVPSASMFEVAAGASIFGQDALVSNLKATTSSLSLMIELNKIKHGSIFSLEHVKDPNRGPLVEANLPALNTPVDLRGVKADVSFRLRLFNITKVVAAQLSDEKIVIELDECFKIANLLQTDKNAHIDINLNSGAFLLSVGSGLSTKLVISDNRIGKITLASVTIKIKIEIDSGKGSAHFSCQFPVAGQSVSFTVDVALSDIESAGKTIVARAEEEAKKVFALSSLEKIRERLNALDPTKVVGINEAIDKINKAIEDSMEQMNKSPIIIEREPEAPVVSTPEAPKPNDMVEKISDGAKKAEREFRKVFGR